MSSAPGLPEFSLAKKVVLVSGAAQGLGLTQAEALLEAGAKGTVTLFYNITIRATTHSKQFMRLTDRPNPLQTSMQSSRRQKQKDRR